MVFGLTAVFAVITCCVSCPWTIHGLWPENGEWCNPTPLNHTAIQPLMNRLKSEWPTCYDVSDDLVLANDQDFFYSSQLLNSDFSFWDHEWEKHGSCTGMDQVHYFNYTLNLYEKLLPSLPSKCQGEHKECKLNVTIS